MSSAGRARCRLKRALNIGRDRLWWLHLGHKVVVPLTLDLKMRSCAQFDRLYQIMAEVGVDPRLAEPVERCARRAAANEPGFKIPFRSIGELAGLPHVIAMPADEVWPGVAVRLRMDDQHCSPTFAVSAFLPVSAPTLPLNTTWVGISPRIAWIISL